MNTWLNSVIQSFIDKNQMSGTLSDKQYNAFIKNMTKHITKGFHGETVVYKYEYKDYTFTVWSNKFTLINEKSWEILQIEDKLNRAKESLQKAIERGRKDREETLRIQIEELEKELLELV